MELRLADGAGLVVAAGDIHNGVEPAFRYLRRSFGPEVPIVMVAGNHEFYGRDIGEQRALAREIARDHRVTWLDDSVAEIGGVRVIGSTLWTDYDLFGEDLREAYMRAASLGLNDHRLIRTQRGAFTPSDARELHVTARAFLARALAEPFAGPSVVVTHHAPHEKSVAARFRGSVLNPAFVSDLSALFSLTARPALWVHGHTHASLDYRVGATRVLCNPLGYAAENPAFDPALVVPI